MKKLSPIAMQFADTDGKYIDLPKEIKTAETDLDEAVHHMQNVIEWIEGDWFGQDILKASPALRDMKEWLGSKGVH